MPHKTSKPLVIDTGDWTFVGGSHSGTYHMSLRELPGLVGVPVSLWLKVSYLLFDSGEVYKLLGDGKYVLLDEDTATQVLLTRNWHKPDEITTWNMSSTDPDTWLAKGIRKSGNYNWRYGLKD